MDAIPNLLNRLSVVTMLIPNWILYRYATVRSNKGCHVYGFDANTAEYTIHSMLVPNDVLAGSDIVVKVNWGPVDANNTGSDKAVFMRLIYNKGDKSSAFTEAVTLFNGVVTIPDGTAAWTIFNQTLGTISNAQGGEWISIELRRQATLGDDTYAHDFFVYPVFTMEYTSVVLEKN